MKVSKKTALKRRTSTDKKHKRKKKLRRVSTSSSSSESSSSSSTSRSSSNSSTSSSSSGSSSSTSYSSSSDDKRRKGKGLKKQSLKKPQVVKNKKLKAKQDVSTDVPLHLMEKSKVMAPMTKEQWEKQQSVVRKVYDESTGRQRLIKGDGEVIEEIVSKERHININKTATKGDGEHFQRTLFTKR